jgi:predicted enzyme related to lactoylglutathione lyase
MNLNQVTVPSTDVGRSIDFYQSLGLILIVENLPSYARFECPEGDATFSVHQTNQPPGSPGVVVYFECEDLDSTVAQLKERGLRFESESQDQPWLWREACLKDPDGNVICLFRAGENRKNPPWRLPAQCLSDFRIQRGRDDNIRSGAVDDRLQFGFFPGRHLERI